jgi:PAS domain S-box-containing protein
MKKSASLHKLRRVSKDITLRHRVPLRISGNLFPFASIDPDLPAVPKVPTLEEMAVQVITSMADESSGSPYAATRLLSLTRSIVKAHAAGLYRAVQETGLLVPLGEIAKRRDVSNKTRGTAMSNERLNALMSNAADHAAKAFAFGLSEKEKASGNRRQMTSADRPFRVRTSGPDGVAVWSTVITRRDDLMIDPENLAGSPTYSQLLGVWVVVTDPLAQRQPNNSDGAGTKPLTALTKRLHPFYSLLMRQVVSREALDYARRQTEKRLREVSTIYEIGKAIDQTDSDALFSLITQKAASVMDAQACSLLVKDVDGDQLTIAASCGLPHDIVDNAKIFVGEGVAGRVAQTGEALLINSDARLDPRLKGRGIVGQPGISSSISTPMKDEDNRVHGVLCIRRRAPAPPFTLEDERLFSIFASQASLAIRNARLYAQMERQVHELNVLYTSSRTLTTTYGLSRACAAVNRVAVEITESDGALLLLFNERLDSLRVRHDLGLSPDIRDTVRLLQDTRDVHREVRLLREPIEVHVSEDDDQSQMFGPRWSRLLEELSERYSAIILVPLVTEEVNVGFLLLVRANAMQFRSDEKKLVSIISSQAAAVLRSAALYEHSVEQRVLELSALYELSKKVRNARTFADALESILDIIASVVWCDEATFHVIDAESGLLRLEAYRGDRIAAEKTKTLEMNSIASWVVHERKALLSSDIAADDRFARIQLGNRARSLMAIPVFLGDDALAVLEVTSSAVNLYTEENVKMISLIAAQAAALFKELESLRELTTYTDNILGSIAAGVVTLDTRSRIVTFNSAAERILRLSASDVLGCSFDTMVELLQADAVDQADTRRMVSLAVETGQTVQRHQLHYYRSNNDDHVIVTGSASRLLNERGEYLGVVLVFEDITKEHEMEQELVRIGRLAEIGELAAGIAHELRNPLASIKGAAQVVLRELSESDKMIDLHEHREFLDIIVNEVDVLSGVTSEFLEFSRFAPPNIILFPLNDSIAKRVQFLRPEFERCDIAVHEDFDDKLMSIEGDPNQLERVFTNILLNGVQAMLDGGLMTVSTRLHQSGKEQFAEIVIKDTGLGMTESQIEKIFTPFFTTKTKGTGLGLAIVQKTLDAHGGKITVQSQPGQGASFTILLPVLSQANQMRVVPVAEGTDISVQRQQAASRITRTLPTFEASEPQEIIE